MPEVSAQSRDKALAAVHAAQEAAAELIRFLREGPASRRPPFGVDDPVAMLADALKLALELEAAEIAALGCEFADDCDARNRLLGALQRFLDEAAF